MTTATETRLQERAASLEVRQVSVSRWQVASASLPGLWHSVTTGAGRTFGQIRCSCQGGRGRCAHRVALAHHLGIDVPDPAPARRNGRKPAPETPEPPAPDVTRVTWLGAITDRATAIQASGALEGGGRVTLDVPDDAAGALSALIGMRRRVLRITVEVVP